MIAERCGRESLQQDVHITAGTGSCGPIKKSSKSSWKSTINWEEKAGFIRSLLLSKTTLHDALPASRLHYLNLPKELHQLRTKRSRIWAFGVVLIQTATSLDSHRLLAVSWHNMHLVQLSKSLWPFIFSTLFKNPVCLLRFKAVSLTPAKIKEKITFSRYIVAQNVCARGTRAQRGNTGPERVLRCWRRHFSSKPSQCETTSNSQSFATWRKVTWCFGFCKTSDLSMTRKPFRDNSP